MAKKIRVSQLTTKSQTILAKKMNMADLESMAKLYTDVVKGIATIEQYRERENKMLKKYGFSV